MHEAFAEKIEAERAYHSTLVGIQRDDVEIFLDEKPARAFASQGQTRSIVLSLKFAVTELIREQLGVIPILLLDDVDSELDQERIARLSELITATATQVLITGTTNNPLFQTFLSEAESVCEIQDGKFVSREEVAEAV